MEKFTLGIHTKSITLSAFSQQQDLARPMNRPILTPCKSMELNQSGDFVVTEEVVTALPLEPEVAQTKIKNIKTE
jgi:hypothetical protein